MKNQVIEGYFVELIPYGIDFVEDVLRLRNTESAKYFLNQTEDLTVEKQLLWTKKYLEKNDDLYWMIRTKKEKTIIGTTALYDINAESCEKGRLIVDKEYRNTKPYVLDAELLILNLAFDVLKVKTVKTCTKVDNSNMQSINSKFGFTFEKNILIRNEAYNYYRLEESDFLDTKLKKTLLHWAKRE